MQAKVIEVTTPASTETDPMTGWPVWYLPNQMGMSETSLRPDLNGTVLRTQSNNLWIPRGKEAAIGLGLLAVYNYRIA